MNYPFYRDKNFSNLFSKVLNKNLTLTKSLHWKILNNWNLIIGDELAKVIKLSRIVAKRKRGKADKIKLELVISCLPQVKVEMLYKAPILLSQINSFLGKEFIHSIKIEHWHSK